MPTHKLPKREVTIQATETFLGKKMVPVYTIIHDASCIKKYKDCKKALAEYEAKWPDYCRKCNGAGFKDVTENQSPMSSGHYWPYTTSEPCQECTNKFKCARCQGELPDYEDTVVLHPCPHCGWNWNRSPGDSLKDPPECYCWEKERERG